ncbi:TPA: hypothetical protein PXP93_001114 [Yersinia enterocolitica]|nr:hypothetical protein [Yersinia enterocolitica]
MTEPRIQKLFKRDGKHSYKFRRADVAEKIAEYFGDDEVDSPHYIRAGRVLREGYELGIIKKVGAARYQMSEVKS